MGKQGYVVLAQNSNGVDYVKQAYLLAKSLHKSQARIKNISLITNDEVPEEYVAVFDKIIPIPFGDHATNSTWKVENRWKVYNASPYYETIVFDADMLVMDSLDLCWRYAKDKEICFTNKVSNYKGQVVSDNTYRKMFVENELPNVYTGFYYFKKGETAETFFKLLELITYNWQRFFFEIAPKSSQSFFSMDVAAAIAVKILALDETAFHPESPFTFVHMKPALQGWKPVPESCYTRVPTFINNQNQLFIGNYMQHGVVHYVEDSFLTDKIVEKVIG